MKKKMICLFNQIINQMKIFWKSFFFGMNLTVQILVVYSKKIKIISLNRIKERL